MTSSPSDIPAEIQNRAARFASLETVENRNARHAAAEAGRTDALAGRPTTPPDGPHRSAYLDAHHFASGDSKRTHLPI